MAYIIQGNWWMMLKAGSLALINRPSFNQPAALHAQAANHAHHLDKHAPWHLPDKLKHMGPLWDKVSLPADQALKHASLSNTQHGHKNHRPMNMSSLYMMARYGGIILLWFGASSSQRSLHMSLLHKLPPLTNLLPLVLP
jgi:hypothetical protein